MFRNSLFAKLFFSLLVAAALIVPLVYYATVPIVDKHIYQLEEQAGKVTLDTIYTLLSRTQRDLAAWQQYSLDSHKRQLKDIVHIAARSLQRIHEKYVKGLLSLADARAEAIALIKDFHYGNNDYLYLCDYAVNLLYHPDPKLNGTNVSTLKDINGRLFMVPMVAKTRASGSAYYDYWWHRLSDDKPQHKITYSEDLPEWGWIIASGVYLGDIQQDTIARKKELLAFLRDFVRSARIATNGYMYVFDGDLNMIIHPNSNIENTNFAALTDPLTGESIGEELIKVAHAKDNKLVYQWDKPSDPGNYIYKKVAWVRYLPEYDYYVASSAYLGDMQSSGNLLASRLLQVGVIVAVLILLLGVALIYSFTHAIKKLALAADGIVAGDLTQQVEIKRNDEIGQLGRSFNLMVDKLREQIDTLEARVAQRTALQSQLVEQLEQNNVETIMLKNASTMLHECRNAEEVFRAVAIIMRKAFPATSGALLNLVYEGQRLEVVSCWNCEDGALGSCYEYDGCFAMRRGTTYIYNGEENNLPCAHLGPGASNPGICVPISAYGDTFGVLNVQYGEVEQQEQQRILRLVEELGEYVSSVLANLRLRIRLQQQSIRDPLTGLFNRRYMDEVLIQEEGRAQRNASQVGIIMIDVDHFKSFNDTYGHETGDEVLRVLGNLLRDFFRESDIVCRYGGEEFIAILPEINLGQCLAKAEQLRSIVENTGYVQHLGETLYITISLGVALYPLHGDKIRTVLGLADDALYQAKAQGRNRVVCTSTVDS